MPPLIQPASSIRPVFRGRAEIGLTGDDDFHIKVSPDGTSFTDALVIDKDNGYVGIGTSAPNEAHGICRNHWCPNCCNRRRRREQKSFSNSGTIRIQVMHLPGF